MENVVESAEALAAEYGMVGYVETSAKENVGVREAFELVARAVVFREEEAPEKATRRRQAARRVARSP